MFICLLDNINYLEIKAIPLLLPVQNTSEVSMQTCALAVNAGEADAMAEQDREQ